jgi:HAD superfamily hydrolase (TIGR01662 family)
MSTYVFDVGETLVDETRHWERIADRIGVPRFTFMSVLGATIAQGRDHRDAFTYFGVDLDRLHHEIDTENNPLDDMTASDLYPDVEPTLRELSNRGHRLGLAANQPERAAAALEAMNLPVAFIATSAQWGVSKPSITFFERLLQVANCRIDEIVYVGDRLDNDVLPAKTFGMRAYLLRRGPWGYLHSELPNAMKADRIINSLTELLSDT